MIWETLIGHAHQAEMFRRAVRRNRLSHAYLLHGPHGIGKRRFAQLLAQCLFCETVADDDLNACGTCGGCRKMAAGTHPDYIEIGLPKGKAEFPIHLIGGDRDHRGQEGLCHDLSLRPALGGRKIAVIDDAETFSQEAANALLKTLEEPPEYCLLMLLADEPESMLSTIRSRCQPVRFGALRDEQVATLLNQLGLCDSPEEANRLASLAGGSLATARQLLDPKIAAVRDVVMSALNADDFHSANVADELNKAVQACGDTPKQRRATAWAARFGIDHFTQQLHAETATPEALEIRAAAIERFALATRQLEQNIQVALVIHALMDDIARLHAK